MSSPQTQTTQTVYDYLLDSQGNAINNAEVVCTLQYELPITISPEPVVTLIPMRIFTRTDQNGYYSFNLVPNAYITPSGTTYQIRTEGTAVQVQVPGTGGPFQVSNILVSAPAILNPAGQTVGALTVTGLLSALAGLLVDGGSDISGGNHVTGGETVDTLAVSGNASVGGTLSLTGAVTLAALLTANGGEIAKQLTTTSIALIVEALSGTASGQRLFQILNHASADVFNVTDAGNLTSQGTAFFNGSITSNVGCSLGGGLDVGGLAQFQALVQFAAHLQSTASATPTLGSLQTGIGSQSISGNDTRGTVSIVTAASSPPGAGANLAVVTFASAYSATPTIVAQDSAGNQSGFSIKAKSATGFTLSNQGGGALATSTTYSADYFVIG